MPSTEKKPKVRGRKPKKRNPREYCVLTVRMMGEDYNKLIERASALEVSLEEYIRIKVLKDE